MEGDLSPSTGKKRGRKMIVISPMTCVIVRMFYCYSFLRDSPVYTRHAPPMRAKAKHFSSSESMVAKSKSTSCGNPKDIITPPKVT